MKRFILSSAFCALVLFPAMSEAVEVVPIGNTIKPEGAPTGNTGSGKRPVKRKPAPTSVKAGKTFMIESAEAVSTGLSAQGETVFFRAGEDVGNGKPVIMSGALATGKIVQLQKDKKNAVLKVEIETVENVAGEKSQISGEVELEGKGEQASYGVGERFTATIDEKMIVKGKPKKEELPTFSKNAFAEIRGKGVKADIKKGVVKGKVELILESSKGLSIDDVVADSVALYRVNNRLTPIEVKVVPGDTKIADRNKNGNSDMALEFDAWDFIKFQPRGNNMIYVKGKLKDGSEFDANTRVTIDY